MDWLSAELANRLQLITLPLELIGLLLATVEVRFPRLTRRLNVRLVAANRAVERSDTRWRANHPRMANLLVHRRYHLPTPGWLQWTVLCLLLLALIGATGLVILDKSPSLEGLRQDMRELLFAFIAWIYIPVTIAALLSMAAIRFIVRFARDRAVGTLGILIAGLGVTGEVYQFLVAVSGVT